MVDDQTGVLATVLVASLDVTAEEPRKLPAVLTIVWAGAELTVALAALNDQQPSIWPVVGVLRIVARHVGDALRDESVARSV